MAGRPPKPTVLKILQGTFRPDRSAANEPMPQAAVPLVPPHLSAEARAEWKRASEELYAVGLLSEVDRTSFGAYCEAWAAWVDACKLWAKKRETEDVLEFKNAFLAFKAASELMHKYQVEFGMTPASRTRINALPKPEEGSGNPFENLG